MDDSAIDKLTHLHNFHNREELFIAIGSKKLILGDADRNVFKTKQGKSWKKLLSFSFGGSKEEKEPNEENLPKRIRRKRSIPKRF